MLDVSLEQTLGFKFSWNLVIDEVSPNEIHFTKQLFIVPVFIYKLEIG